MREGYRNFCMSALGYWYACLLVLLVPDQKRSFVIMSVDAGIG